jgi:hypothetical protein
MLYSDNVQDSRQIFYTSWKKYKTNELLTALEQQIVSVILEHPEYHSLLEDIAGLNRTFHPELGEANPFLHMGLHLAIRDQIQLDRPLGIAIIYKNLVDIHKDPLKVEHIMIEYLAECLWEAQRDKKIFDEEHYLRLLKK